MGRIRHGGFTLLELLIALTLFAILMTALLGGLRFGTRVFEASTDRLEDSDRLSAVRSFLRQRLEEVAPVNGAIEGASDDQPVFVGEPTRLRLASTMPESLGQGLFLLELSLQPNAGDDAGDLHLRWRPWPGAAEGGIDERAILRNVAGLSMAYFAQAADDRAGGWRDSWSEPGRLPELIRIDLTFVDGDRRRWQPLIVSPMIDEWYDTFF